MSSFPKELCFHLSDKLHPLDSECQTYGCRHSNPDICGACFITGICAFSSEDKVRCVENHLLNGKRFIEH